MHTRLKDSQLTTKRPKSESSGPVSPGIPHKKLKITILILAALSLLTAAVIGAAVIWISSFIKTPADRVSKPITFTVASGQPFDAIARNLQDQDLISNPTAFKLYARLKKAARRIKAGEYEMNTAMSPKAILALLISGKNKLYRLTIPEGLNMEEIATLVEQAGICSKKYFLSVCSDLKFIKLLKIPGMTLEGYLFPDTYFFSKKTTCKTLIKKMVSTFNKTFNDKWKIRAKEMGLSVHEVVILASIIEKETGNAAERPIISSVFHNRLKRNMRLESDPTVIYGVSDYHGRIRYKHLRRVTPYNTYKINGLSAGPIANPGALALKAALYPARTKYLFFVSKNDTTHQFSTNLRAHNLAVKKYQLK